MRPEHRIGTVVFFAAVAIVAIAALATCVRGQEGPGKPPPGFEFVEAVGTFQMQAADGGVIAWELDTSTGVIRYCILNVDLKEPAPPRCSPWAGMGDDPLGIREGRP